MSTHPFTTLVEPLEARIAPAVLIGAGGKTATFTDVDGDLATITISTGTLTAANFTTDASGLGEQLQRINLSAGGFDGTNLSVTAKKSATGDGRVNVGYILSFNRDLGNVKVNGDLGGILAGDAFAAQPGVKQLAVDSFGRLGIDTQPAGGSVQSIVDGDFGALVVKGDFVGAALHVLGSKLGTVKIGGSLIGGEGDGTGVLGASTIGSLQIGHDLRGGDGAFAGQISAFRLGAVRIGGSVIGGAGMGSGQINVIAGDLGSVTIGHSVVGGAGQSSGSIVVDAGDLGVVKIGQDLLGGAGELSGRLQANLGDLKNITIGGSVVGGAGDASGDLFGGSDIGTVRIAHDLLGGEGVGSGRIVANGAIASLTIGGSLIGGSGSSSGRIVLGGELGSLRVGHDFLGGSGVESGSLEALAIKSARIGGSLSGGSADVTGFLSSGAGGTAFVSIGGSLLGSAAQNSGYLRSDGDLGVVKIGHDLKGGSGTLSGYLDAKKIGSVSIAGSLVGGSGNSSGYIRGDVGGIALVCVGGSIIGGSGPGFYTGGISSIGDLGTVTIGHDLIGGSISGTDDPVIGSGYIQSAGGRIGAVTIGGSIISGSDTSTGGFLALNASIRAANDIGALVVKGNLVGNSNADGDSPVIISARGQAVQGATTDVAIGKITIGGSVEFSTILAGYSALLTGVNADAQIGAVKVGGSWAASSLVAGVADVGADGFGNFFDDAIAGGNANIISRIASITIGKLAVGTPESLAPADHFGFVAQQVGALTAGGRTFALTAGSDNFLVGPTNDLRIREVA